MSNVYSVLTNVYQIAISIRYNKCPIGEKAISTIVESLSEGHGSVFTVVGEVITCRILKTHLRNSLEELIEELLAVTNRLFFDWDDQLKPRFDLTAMVYVTAIDSTRNASMIFYTGPKLTYPIVLSPKYRKRMVVPMEAIVYCVDDAVLDKEIVEQNAGDLPPWIHGMGPAMDFIASYIDEDKTTTAH